MESGSSSRELPFTYICDLLLLRYLSASVPSLHGEGRGPVARTALRQSKADNETGGRLSQASQCLRWLQPSRVVLSLKQIQRALISANDAVEEANKEHSRLAAIVDSSDDAIFSKPFDEPRKRRAQDRRFDALTRSERGLPQRTALGDGTSWRCASHAANCRKEYANATLR
jgi:hypothetical protein